MVVGLGWMAVQARVLRLVEAVDGGVDFCVCEGGVLDGGGGGCGDWCWEEL